MRQSWGETTTPKTTCAARRNWASGGTYSREVEMANVLSHPYIAWLVEAQGANGIQLDWLAFLEMNADTPIGDERIEWIRDRLLERL